ncbi:hypothetical protein PIB30_030969 [Stylosanthes scabra]|uniref:Uncharacterized protein n=1 Tax=Stylosanthes scabra TaxID=79078 RepID=A0ABU6TBF1_9FABA|nr:hypothetical protein [Stylosanthes scabra]
MDKGGGSGAQCVDKESMVDTNYENEKNLFPSCGDSSTDFGLPKRYIDDSLEELNSSFSPTKKTQLSHDSNKEHVVNV